MTWRRSSSSLRDPDARVWCQESQVARAFSRQGAESWQQFCDSGLYQELVDQGHLTAVQAMEDVPPEISLEDGGLLVGQERVPVIGYPCEWPFYTLQQAALLHLRLLSRLALSGFTLKDAPASNVQWMGRPVFIDLGSFVPRPSGAVWRGYNQFCATMLFPLMLSDCLGVPFQPWLRGQPTGFEATDMARLLGWRKAFRPGVLRDVLLQAALQKMSSGKSSAEFSGLQLPDKVFLQLLARLERVVSSLKDRTVSPWSSYEARLPYELAEKQVKVDCIDRWLGRLPRKPAMAWDVGANLGEYSRIAARHCQWVVALEKDVGAASRLAAALHAEAVPNITVLCHDFADPSPPAGWLGAERQPLSRRAPPDLMLTLAVLHHLCLGGGLDLSAVVAAMAALAPLHISEFVAPEDPMASWLAGNIGIPRPDYTSENFRSAIRANGRIVDEFQVNQTRTLYLWEAGR